MKFHKQCFNRTLIVAFGSLALQVFASSSNKLVQSSTIELGRLAAEDYSLSCSPGVPLNRAYPTASSLVLRLSQYPFEGTIDELVASSFPLMGDVCNDFTQRFLATVISHNAVITRDRTETCVSDDNHPEEGALLSRWVEDRLSIGELKFSMGKLLGQKRLPGPACD